MPRLYEVRETSLSRLSTPDLYTDDHCGQAPRRVGPPVGKCRHLAGFYSEPSEQGVMMDSPYPEVDTESQSDQSQARPQHSGRNQDYFRRRQYHPYDGSHLDIPYDQWTKCLATNRGLSGETSSDRTEDDQWSSDRDNRRYATSRAPPQRDDANNSSCLDVFRNPPLLKCQPLDTKDDDFILTPCQIDILLSLAACYASNTAMVDNCKFALLSGDHHSVINNYLIAAKFQLFDVMDRLLDQIRANFVCVARTKEFLSLPVDIVLMFLQDNFLNVACELEIFFAALSWVDFNKMQRLPDAGKVLNCVRYLYISPSDLLKFVEPNLHLFTGPEGLDAMLNMYRYRALILSGTVTAPHNVLAACLPERPAEDPQQKVNFERTEEASRIVIPPSRFAQTKLPPMFAQPQPAGPPQDFNPSMTFNSQMSFNPSQSFNPFNPPQAFNQTFATQPFTQHQATSTQAQAPPTLSQESDKNAKGSKNNAKGKGKPPKIPTVQAQNAPSQQVGTPMQISNPPLLFLESPIPPGMPYMCVPESYMPQMQSPMAPGYQQHPFYPLHPYSNRLTAPTDPTQNPTPLPSIPPSAAQSGTKIPTSKQSSNTKPKTSKDMSKIVSKTDEKESDETKVPAESKSKTAKDKSQLSSPKTKRGNLLTKSPEPDFKEMLKKLKAERQAKKTRGEIAAKAKNSDDGSDVGSDEEINKEVSNILSNSEKKEGRGKANAKAQKEGDGKGQKAKGKDKTEARDSDEGERKKGKKGKMKDDGKEDDDADDDDDKDGVDNADKAKKKRTAASKSDNKSNGTSKSKESDDKTKSKESDDKSKSKESKSSKTISSDSDKKKAASNKKADNETKSKSMKEDEDLMKFDDADDEEKESQPQSVTKAVGKDKSSKTALNSFDKEAAQKKTSSIKAGYESDKKKMDAHKKPAPKNDDKGKEKDDTVSTKTKEKETPANSKPEAKKDDEKAWVKKGKSGSIFSEKKHSHSHSHRKSMSPKDNKQLNEERKARKYKQFIQLEKVEDRKQSAAASKSRPRSDSSRKSASRSESSARKPSQHHHDHERKGKKSASNADYQKSKKHHHKSQKSESYHKKKHILH